MSDHLTFDLVEDILLRLDGEDLIRCKSVCKSWLSFISSSIFIKTHLNYNYNNPKLGYRRIIVPTYDHANMIDDGEVVKDSEYYHNNWCIVGSSNGLVCFITSLFNNQVVVTNPLTREVKKLQTSPWIPKDFDRSQLCFGFGYDSLTDDYKVVMGMQMDKGAGTLFQVLTLKSNIWKVTRQVKYKLYNLPGILWNGAFHWFMQDYQSMKKVILSFDLSREEFKEIPQPDDSRYVGDSTHLGITEGCLCIYRNKKPYQRWVMKNYNDNQSWELLPGLETITYDVAHMLKCYNIPHKNWCLCDEDGYKFYSTIGKYIRCPIYVHSLVSPHLNGKPKHTKNQKESDKRGVKLGCYSKVFSCFTTYKVGGPFLPLAERKAASIPKVEVGSSTYQPPPYSVEDGTVTHNPWKKTVLGVTYLHNILKRKRRPENIKLNGKICSK